MSIVNSHGNGQPSAKTILVETNLLDVWIGERKLNEERLNRAGAVTGSLVLAICCVLPVLISLAMSRTSLAHKSQLELKELELQTSSAEQLAVAADPTLQREAMNVKSTNKATSFLMALTAAMNSAPDTVCLTEVRSEILGGDLTISGKAEAINSTAAHDFIHSLGKTQGISSALMEASRPDTTLGPNGVTFEFLARTEVAPS